MAEVEDGMAALGQRVERRSRTVPPPRHDKAQVVAVAAPEVQAPEPVPKSAPSKPAAKRPAVPKPAGKVVPMADEPKTSVTHRLRGSVDEAIERCAFNLRDLGVKGVSKGELIEMACVEVIPQVPDEELAAKVRAYRAKLAASAGELA